MSEKVEQVGLGGAWAPPAGVALEGCGSVMIVWVGELYWPSALRVMAEHGADEGVWDPGSDHYGPVELEPLGVSAGLVQRLKDWNGEFQALALTEDFEFASEEEELEWIRRGLHLAYELQNELPDIAVSYAHDNDDRPVRERRGA